MLAGFATAAAEQAQSEEASKPAKIGALGGISPAVLTACVSDPLVGDQDKPAGGTGDGEDDALMDDSATTEEEVSQMVGNLPHRADENDEAYKRGKKASERSSSWGRPY